MINKDILLNSFSQAIDDTLTSVNDELSSVIQNRVDSAVQQEFSQVDIDQKVQIGVDNYLASIVDQTQRDALLSRITVQTDDFVEKLFNNVALDISKQIQAQANDIISTLINGLDFSGVVRHAIHQTLTDIAFVENWPNNSIPIRVLDFDNDSISASVLNGGVAANFSSTGLVDQATRTVLSLNDKGVTVDSNLTVTGNITFNGAVELGSAFFQDLTTAVGSAVEANAVIAAKTTVETELANSVLGSFTTGIDLSNITVNSEPLVKDSRLHKTVIESSIQKVGRLRELDVGGTVNLNDTVRVVKNRVGINTQTPTTALEIWDQEIQILAGKQQANTAFIGLGRPGVLQIGVDGDAAVTILSDNAVTITDLSVGRFERVKLAVSSEVPSTAGTPGDIIFNSDPKSNGVFAWCCLEGTRWAPVRLDI